MHVIIQDGPKTLQISRRSFLWNRIGIGLALFFSVLKKFSHNSLFLILIATQRDYIKHLNKTIYPAVKTNTFFVSKCKKDSFNSWIDSQQNVSRYLSEFNCFVTPYLLTTTISNASTLCLVTFSIVMRNDLPVHSHFALICLAELVILCYAGHSLKREGQELINTLNRIPILNERCGVGHTLARIVSDCRSSLRVNCEPFFTLCYEYLIALISVITTYFIVLVQIQ
ncbi:Hypothetical predicted protein [Cloeon dipterum]|uniref:Uncharacterized protein n=1 Tax=Cloeon dipterum TaxID=197152 RepID=A0A8S1C3M8_9INSE|nr:Hypothetical predicted protein [Cloeon dipterum]